MNCKAKHILIFILSIAILKNSFSQCGNLIINESFENAAFSANDDIYPNWHSQIYQKNFINDDEYIQAWQTDQLQKMQGSDSAWLHSPDWFKTNSILFHKMKEKWINPDPFGDDIHTTATARTGNGYIGMTDAELVQQKLTSNLEDGKVYSLEMYIRPVKVTRGMVDIDDDGNDDGYYLSEYSWTGGAKFRAWIAKDKIKYQHDNFDDDCTDDNDLFSTPLTDKIEILNMTLNLSDFTENDDKSMGVYEWKKVYMNFTAPNIDVLEENYKWLVIELAGNSTTDPCNVYLLIDDVSLNRGCQVECSRTDGCFSPDISGITCWGQVIAPIIGKGWVIKFSNLANVKKATIHVTDSYFINIYNSQITCENGIDGSIFWDGRDNFDNPVAPGIYPLILTLENECGTDVFNYNVEVTDPYDPYLASGPCYGIFFSDFSCNEYNLVTPAPCCSEQPDIYINNLTIGNPESTGSLEYIAVNNIYIGPNVTIENDAVVLFQAGNEIIGDPFQEAEIGSDVTAEIVPCPVMRLANPYPVDETADNLFPVIPEATFKPDTNPLLPQKQNIQILPNPSASGAFSVSGLPFSLTSSITVYNILGEKIYEKQMNANPGKIGAGLQIDASPNEQFNQSAIDISTHPKGVYFVKISNGEEISVQKIIYE